MTTIIRMQTTQQNGGVLYSVVNQDGVVVWGRFERFGPRSMAARVNAAREQERIAHDLADELRKGTP